MKSLFKFALACFIFSAWLSLSSKLLGTWLQYTSYLLLFNALATAILLSLLASLSFSIAGILRERYNRYRYLLLMVANLIFFVWVMLE